MEAIALNLVLPLLQQLLPLFNAGAATSSTIGLVIKGLQIVIPMIGPLTSNIVPKIKNIISVVSASPEATAVQVAALEKLDAESDAAFDAAVAAAEEEDAKEA